MSRKILLETYNLALPKGTGIKTYARTLGQVARGLGHKVDALVESGSRLNPKDDILSEIAFHDGRTPNGWRARWIHNPLEIAIGRPFGLDAQALRGTGVVIDNGGGLISQFDGVHAAPMFTRAARRHFRRYGRLMPIRVENQQDIFHATHLTPVRVPGAANVYTIHDVIPLRLPTSTLDNKKLFLKMLRVVCREADAIVTVSECSKQDILRVTGIREEKIEVTYQSCSIPKALIDKDESEIARVLNNNFLLEPQGYFLYFGALEPKKNVSRLIDAYAAAGVAAPLVIAGGLGWSYEKEVEQIEQEHFSSWRLDAEQIRRVRRVRRLDHLSLSHLTALIRGARAVLFPSLYEGFGLPVLEAMTLGAPVMTSNVSSLPEVAGEAALLVDPYDVDAMTTAIRTLDADADLRADLSARGRERARVFSTAAYAPRVDAFYRRL